MLEAAIKENDRRIKTGKPIRSQDWNRVDELNANLLAARLKEYRTVSANQ